MTFFKYFFVAFALFTTPTHAADAVFAKDNIANKGYDVLAYFSLNAGDKAIKGSADFSATHNGYSYHFASAANRDAFNKEPNKYLPAYGGYCAYAIAAYEKKVKIDPNAWSIVDETLYLNFNHSVQKDWEAKQTSYIKDGDRIWPSVKDTAFKKGWF